MRYLQIWCADVVLATKDGENEVIIRDMCVYKAELELLQADKYLAQACARYIAGVEAMKRIDTELTTGLKRIKKVNYKFYLSHSNVTYEKYVTEANDHRSRVAKSFQFSKHRVVVSTPTGKNPTRAINEIDLSETD